MTLERPAPQSEVPLQFPVRGRGRARAVDSDVLQRGRRVVVQTRREVRRDGPAGVGAQQRRRAVRAEGRAVRARRSCPQVT